MPFLSSLAYFGEVAVMSHDPVVLRAFDGIYVPFSSQVFFDQDPLWGIYTPDGTLVSEAAYRRGSDRHLIGQSPTRHFDDEPLAVEAEEHLYFGPLIPHYGHFLITGLARAWFAARPEFKDRPLLCHSDLPVQNHFRNYMGVLTAALGVTPERFVRPTQPIRFRNLTIPGPAFVEQAFVHEAFAAPMRRIGDTLHKGAGAARQARPAWLSKSRMGINSVTHITNETKIEDALTACGFDIIFPEQLTLPQQINLFSTREHLLGFAGSAFHNHIFSRNPPKITCVTLEPFINTNFLLLDRLNHVNASYFYPYDNIETEQTPGYSISRKITDIPRFVRDLLDVSGLPTRNIHPGYFCRASERTEVMTVYNENCLPDLAGESYRDTLQKLHRDLNPRAYLEIGTLTGGTLALSRSPSIAIDPKFQISSDVVGEKSLCLFYQLESDTFFKSFNPETLLGSALDFSFLDGMHRCEFLLRDIMNTERHSRPSGIIALHDCIPVEIPMTDRMQNGTPPIAPHRGGWWTGDVWRTVLALKRHRTDLNILCLDAAPTGLVLIANLDPASTYLAEHYDTIVEEMMAMDLEAITVAKFMREIEVATTTAYNAPGSLVAALGR